MRDNPAALRSSGAFKDLGDYESQHHVRDKGHPDVHRVFRDLRRLLDGYQPDRVAIGEIHEFDWPAWAAYYGRDLDELHMPFNFSLVHAPWQAVALRARIEAQEAALPPGAWPNHVLGNHDEPRLATRFGRENARLAAMLLLTLRGTPTMYYGDEIGLPEARIPDHLQQDPWGRRVPGMGRDGCRTPMQWDTSPGAGFSAGPPWLPVTADHADRNVEAQLADPGSLLNLYRALLALRKGSAALRSGSYESVDSPDDVLAYRREAGAEDLLVALNLGDEPATVAATGTVLQSTVAGRTGPVSGRVALAPREGVVAALA
jgi:alpha-glucosidase